MKKWSLLLLIIILFGCQPKKSEPISEKINQDSINALKKADSLKVLSDKANSLGIWEIRYYVDEFGDKTKQGFVGNKDLIKGSFSNSATEGSDLNVKMLIDGEDEIAIQLFEYAGTNPVKGSAYDEGYRISIKYGNEMTDVLDASCYSDRLTLNAKNSKKLSEILKLGGSVKFSIIEKNRSGSASSYKFELADVSGYQNALNKLPVKSKK